MSERVGRGVATATHAVLTPRDERVLASLSAAGYLSRAQLERLHFPSTRVAQRRLRALLDHGFVRANLQGGALHRDNVYTLTPDGLEMAGGDKTIDKSPGRVPRFQKIAHGLAIRDAWVAFTRAVPRATLLAFDFEEALCRDAVLAAAGIVPDARVRVRVGDAERVVYVEVDLGTETTTTLREKLRCYRQLLASPALADAELLLIARTESRIRTLERVADATKVALRTSSFDALERDLGRLYGRVYVPGVRAERTATPTEHPGFEPIASRFGSAFRPIG